MRDARGASISESRYPGWGEPRPNQPDEPTQPLPAEPPPNAWGFPPPPTGQPRWGQPAGEPPPPGRRPVRTPLIVAGGIVLLVIAVVAVLTLRGVGNAERTASSGATATSSTGAGSGGPITGSDDSNSDPGGGSGGTWTLRFPDRVGGLTRIPTGVDDLSRGEAKVLDRMTRTQEIEAWGFGVYGRSADDPRLVFIVFRAKSPSMAGLIGQGMAGGVGRSLGGGVSSRRTITRNGVGYDCWNQAAGSVCEFQRGATVGVSFDRQNDLDQLSQLTDEARRGVHG